MQEENCQQSTHSVHPNEVHAPSRRTVKQRGTWFAPVQNQHMNEKSNQWKPKQERHDAEGCPELSSHPKSRRREGGFVHCRAYSADPHFDLVKRSRPEECLRMIAPRQDDESAGDCGVLTLARPLNPRQPRASGLFIQKCGPPANKWKIKLSNHQQQWNCCFRGNWLRGWRQRDHCGNLRMPPSSAEGYSCSEGMADNDERLRERLRLIRIGEECPHSQIDRLLRGL